MAKDEVTTLGALTIATVALMLVGHRLPVIPIDLSRVSWQAPFDAGACPGCVFADYLLAP